MIRICLLTVALLTGMGVLAAEPRKPAPDLSLTEAVPVPTMQKSRRYQTRTEAGILQLNSAQQSSPESDDLVFSNPALVWEYENTQVRLNRSGLRLQRRF